MKTTENTTSNRISDRINAGIKEIHNLIILDRSGSMMSIANQAIAGVNETIGTIKATSKENDITQYITITSFCGCSTIDFCKNTRAEKVSPMTPRDYQPCCSTPLYDAMGTALTALRETVKNRTDVAVSVTIITDGYENASRKWTGPQIKALIELLKADGWLFAFIGANQDMEEIKFNLSIDNTMAFEATVDGTAEMFKKERMARAAWVKKASMASHPDRHMNKDYFEDSVD